jgi:hypothetical protein
MTFIDDITTLVPAFSADVLNYAANVSDVIFEVSLAYSTEDAAGDVAVAVSTARSRRLRRRLHASASGVDDNSSSSADEDADYEGMRKRMRMRSPRVGVRRRKLLATSAAQTLEHGANVVRLAVTHNSDADSVTTYVVTVTRLSLPTHASLVALTVAQGQGLTLAPIPLNLSLHCPFSAQLKLALSLA